jgi:hypothetical protein
MRALATFLAMFALACAEPASEPLPLGDDAESCASCHAEHAAEHRASPHATSAASPVLAAMLPEVEREWGLVARQTCEGCHAPAHSSDEGIGCVSCHAAIGNHEERDGMLAVDTSRPLAGPFDDAARNEGHESRRGDFLASPSLCGTCHEITGPVLVDEPTLSEYRASSQAAEGLTCADCHLPDEGERPLVPGGRARPVSSHRFVGFDPPWGASDEEARAAAERTRALLAAALELALTPTETGVAIEVRNVGAGHAVPTGATFLRDLWVDVEIDGVASSRVIRLGDQPMNIDVPVPLLTRATHVEHGSLGPGEARRVELAVDSGARVVVHLRGRAIREEALAALGLSARGSEVPTHEIAEVVLVR